MSRFGTGLALTALTLLGASMAATSCGGSGGSSGGGGGAPVDAALPQAELRVFVTFPGETEKTSTASVHVWALAPRGEAGMPPCSALKGGVLEPYDLSLEQRADVAVAPSALPAGATGVVVGPALVYVEAVAFDGVTSLAGCQPADVVQPVTEVTVILSKAGVFDCTDASTEEGAPCDDGKACTIGEKCAAGSCKGGTVRDCSYLTDACNAAVCDEKLGCVANPLPDSTPCDDAAYCSEGDVCKAGICTGQARDCNKEVTAQCKVATGCSESSKTCLFSNAPSLTPCDDGNYCTVNDACSSFGSCTNTQARDCSAVADQCNTASCNEATDTCTPIPKSSLTVCNDGLACTSSDKCNGAGQCAGTVQKDCSTVADQCNVGTCTEPNALCVKTPKMDGTPCDDNNGSTSNDVCTSGTCAGT